MALYSFERLKSYVDRVAPSIIDIKRRYLVVKDEDFTYLHNSDKTFFDDEGIYVNIHGINFRRYIYLKNYHVKRYERFPVFHIIACSKVQDIGRYHYISASSSCVDVLDIDTNTLHKNKNLKLCSYCRTESLAEFIPGDTNDFFNTLEKIEEDDINISELRPDGYTWDWDIISEIYRKSKNYICENPECKIRIEKQFDRFLLHVHHINGNKSFNNPKNLESLCILCHTYTNEHHKNQLFKKRLFRQLSFFVDKYRIELTELKNPFLKEFDKIPKDS